MLRLSFSRGFRLLVLLVCVVAFLVLSSISLTKFIRAEVVRSFEVDESALQEFAVIFCKTQSTIFKPDVYKTITGREYQEVMDPMQLLVDQFPFGEQDLEAALWNMTYGFDDFFDICASFYNKPCDPKDIVSHLYHYGGQCHTVRYDNSLAEGRQRGLMLQLKPMKCDSCFNKHWVMYVFSAKEHYLDWEHVWAPPRVFLELDKEQTFKVKRTLEKRLPTDERPCKQDERYARSNCIKTCFSAELARLGRGCRLPWMEVDLPVCNNRSDFEHLMQYSRMVSRANIVWAYKYEELQENHHYKALKRIEGDCKKRCMRECHRDHVTVTLADRALSNYTFITLSINEGLYVSKQRRAYDIQQMISDIGGNLGLLLGASIFTLFEMVETAAREFWERRKSQRATNVTVKSADVTGRTGDVTGLQDKCPAGHNNLPDKGLPKVAISS